jgi:hypothetical protein
MKAGGKIRPPPSRYTKIGKEPFEVMAMDMVGPYIESRRGNRYVVTFICTLTNFPFAYAIADAEAQLLHFITRTLVILLIIYSNILYL